MKSVRTRGEYEILRNTILSYVRKRIAKSYSKLYKEVIDEGLKDLYYGNKQDAKNR